jgi:tetratricopeptide (TPR) repeat protein
MLVERRLEWRSTPVDLPLSLLLVLVLVQLALGNRSLVAWALASPASGPDMSASLPPLFLTVGTIAPAHTGRALLLLLTYAGAYTLVISLIRTRLQLDRLVSMLLILGGGMAFLGLLDYLAHDAWLLRWRDSTATGRLSGTFVNPDHFAAWLTMLIFLGIGYVLARRLPGDGQNSLMRMLRSHEGRERAVRRCLPFIALVTMAVALVFTLSRGGLVSGLLVALALLALLRTLGRIQWGLAAVGALLVTTLGYATWIGLEPLLARVWHADHSVRWVQFLSTLPMLRSFPVLGVGLGAYRDIYPRYQPLALSPGRVYLPYAHNDLLQLVVELGLVGGVVVLFIAWRVGKDLLGAHLLGRATCPVGGGEHEGAQRHDFFSVGLGVGAVGSVLALLVHSAFDFGARIPANGILAATCLGIATVALHTRFQATGDRLLTKTWIWSLENRPGTVVALGAALIALLLALVPWIVRPPLVGARLAAAELPGTDRPTALRRVEAALALDSRDARALALRGRLRLQTALEIWNSGLTPDGQLLASLEERRQAGLVLVRGADKDFRDAIAQVPSESWFHDGRGRAFWALALLETENASRHLDAALASFSRAVALAPDNPFPHWTLAVFAVPQGGRYTEAGLHAAREAVARDPQLLGDLVDQFLPLRLSGAQWVAMVPESATARAELGAVLEERRLLAEAAQAYRGALEVASTGQAPLSWLLARLELRQQRPREALGAIEAGLARDPDSPELHLVRAEALAALGDPGALTAYRLAVLKAEVPAGRPAGQPFGVLAPRVQTLVSRALEPPAGPARYHRALAQYLADRALWEQALLEWDAVLAAVPEDAAAHFARGTVLDALGRGTPALQEYRQAVALDGTQIAFRLRLARRLWETEQYYQAMNEWRSVVGQDPGNVEARLGLARAAAKAGDRAAAAQEYLRILQIVPDQPEARRELARLGRATGN